MATYCFSTDSDKNAHQAINSGCFAFKQARRPGKDSKLGMGDTVLFYSAESKKFFAAGTVTSKPQYNKTITDKIWDGTWYSPVDINILKESAQGINGKETIESLPSSRKDKRWSHRLVINNNVAATDLSDDDFKLIVEKL